MKWRNNAYIGLYTCIPTTGAEDAVISFREFFRKHFHLREDGDHQDEGFYLKCLLDTPTKHLFAKPKQKITKTQTNKQTEGHT